RDRWTAEVSIPLKVLGAAGIGRTWGFNIGRGQAGAQAYASFAGIQGKWASPGGFATLKFVEQAGDEGRLVRGRGTVRVFALHPQQPLDLLNLPAPDDEYLNAFGTPGEVVPYTFHVLNLESKMPVSVDVAATAFTGPAGRLDVPADAFLYLYPVIAGSYAWEFLGAGTTTTVLPGQRGGFWLDYRVPDDAKPGVYSSTVTLTIHGKAQPAHATRTVKLLVLPFKLDANPTSCGFHTPRDRDARMLEESMRLMREHGMTTFAPYGGWGGPAGVDDYVRLRKRFGFEGKTIYADGCMYVGDQLARQMNLAKTGPASLQKGRCWVVTEEYRKRYVDAMKKYYDAAVAAGFPEMSFSIGDELTNDGYHAALHSIDRARILREGIPKMVLTTDTNGYTEAVGCSKYLNAVGVNDGWDGPDNHNGGKRILTPAVMKEIRANKCGIEFVNTGTDRFPYGFYLWRMTEWGVQSKTEWIWDSDRVSPAWLNVYREQVRDGKPTGQRIDRYRPPEEWKTFVTVALKFSRMGTYDSQYAATLRNLVKRIPDPTAKQLLDDVTAHIPLELAASRGSGWDASRCDTVRWALAQQIMRLKGQSVGVDTTPRTNLGDLAPDPSSRWSAATVEKQFIRHKSRTFACAKVAEAPTVDGKLDDDAWKSAEAITGVYDDRGISLIGDMPNEGLIVRAVHTDEGVYLYIRSFEPKPEKISTSTQGDEDPGLWRVDDIEVFIDPGKTGEYYHLVYDAKGTKTDWKKTEIAWNGKWEVACRLEGNEWTSELFLPFDTFGGKGKPWGIFVGRGSPTRGAYYGIMPIQGSWHSVEQFGTLEFKEVQPHVYYVKFGRLQVGENTVDIVTAVLPDGRLAAGAEIVLPDGTRKRLSLPGGRAPGVQFGGTFELQRPGEQELTLRALDDKGAVLDSETFIVRVPAMLSLALAPESLFSDDVNRRARLAMNLRENDLPKHALEIEVTGDGFNQRFEFKPLAGNRLDLVFGVFWAPTPRTLPAVRLTRPTGEQVEIPEHEPTRPRPKAIPLREGKYTLTARLTSGGKTVATDETEFFVIRGPNYGR
ncbi:MAG TPA: hypothetical protein VMY39_05035, partial [Planctomycetota bacterium]|nr:hypothetical protein [Planctomycetota bacterium]